MEGSYQFIHVDAYGREGSTQTKISMDKHGAKVTTTTKSRSAKEILSEQWREDGACPHIKNPGEPTLLYGVPPQDVLPIMNEWADQAKDAQGRKLRKDGNCVLIGVASLPRAMEDQFPEFAEDTLEWLKEKYGDRLKSVVVHNDESHPHLHFTVVPHIGERFDEIHEGIRAKNEAKKNNKKAGDQNYAYKEAMRAFQDEFSKKVAMAHGLTRIGPARRRLTRAQWHAERKQAAFFADAKSQHRAVRENAYKVGLKKAEVKAQEIIANAQKQAAAIGAKFGGWLAGFSDTWHKPSAQAIAQAEKIKEDAETEKKKSEKIKKDAVDWANKRVAEVANQLTIEKTKNNNLISELNSAEKTIYELSQGLKIYQERENKKTFKKV